MIAELLASTTLLAAPTPGEAAAAPVDPGSRRVLVTFKPARTSEGLTALEQSDGVVQRSFIATSRTVAADLPPDEIARLERDPAVAFVEPDTPNRPFALSEAELDPTPFNGLYGLLTTRAVAAQTGIRPDQATVCVADTGVDPTHPDLQPAYGGGVDTIDRDDDPSAPLGGSESHGTHVAGTIVGALNGYGVRGVAPGVRFIHARVLGPDGGTASTVMDGVRRLVEEHGCNIINMSLGGEDFTVAGARFYAEMRQRGVLIVAASGNQSAAKVSYPAAYDGVLSVGAVDRANQHASFSNTGQGLDVVGPGVEVLSSLPRGTGRAATITLPDAQPTEVMEVGNSGLTEGVSGSVVDVGNAPNAAAFNPEQVRGNIALVSPERNVTMPLLDLLTAALDAGASAVAIVAPGPTPYVFKLPLPVTDDGRTWMPIVSLTADQGTAVKQAGAIAIVNRPSDWGHANGTSMASPHVAGVAGILKAAQPSLTPDRIEQLLESTATDLGPGGYDVTYGNGLVDAERALAAARQGHGLG